VPVNNVDLLVDFRLGNKPLLAFVKGLGSLFLVMFVWEIPASAPTAGNRGNLSGPWVIGRIFCALEFYIPATATSSLRAPRKLPDSITRASRRC
jgi:hypothetical protein